MKVKGLKIGLLETGDVKVENMEIEELEFDGSLVEFIKAETQANDEDVPQVEDKPKKTRKPRTTKKKEVVQEEKPVDVKPLEKAVTPMEEPKAEDQQFEAALEEFQEKDTSVAETAKKPTEEKQAEKPKEAKVEQKKIETKKEEPKVDVSDVDPEEEDWDKIFGDM